VIRIRTTVPLVAALALALPASAPASPATRRAIIRDCAQDGKLDHHYSRHDLKDAKEHIPTDVREYTDCDAVIGAALRNGGGGSSTGAGTGGNPALKTSAGATAGSSRDLGALKSETDRTRNGGKPSVVAGGQTLSPASSGLHGLAGSANKLPLPMLVAILAVAALCVAGGIAAAWRRWPSVVRAPLRLLRR